ncbi:hypothetical protein DFS34DRAFT_682566 [Phlyctochytrium arcticum]|nr:hypothetical protein DFS34DRAFT_682566 [Phlyctochytrium arcticum]
MCSSRNSEEEASGKVQYKTSAPLRIFLVQSAQGLFASSGGYRANMAFCRAMASAGHTIKMIAQPYAEDFDSFKGKVEKQDKFITMGETDVDAYRFKMHGIEMVGLDAEQYTSAKADPDVKKQSAQWLEDEVEVPALDARRAFLLSEIKAFKPTHILMNEPTSLKIAMDDSIPSTITRVFIAHDCNNLPFGPFSDDGPAKRQHQQLRDVEGLWVVSKAFKAYFSTFGGLEHAKVLPNHPCIFSDEPDTLPYCDNWDEGVVCAINPGAIKGFHLTYAIAQSMPDVQFLVTKSWSMSEHCVSKFEELENVKVEESYKDMEKLWSQVKLLLMPSVAFESFGLVVVEALLRGIPVISSDAGGLTEAHLGVPWVLPVTPLTGEKETDPDLIDKFGPWRVPDNDPQPWVHTLHAALCDRDAYNRAREEGRTAAMEFVKGLKTEMYEEWLRSLMK